MLRKFKKWIGRIIKPVSQKRHALVGDGKLWKMKRNFQFHFLLQNGLKDDHKFLDIGCGTLRGGIPIIKYLQHGNYYGIEVRENVLAEAKRELKETGLEIKNPHLLYFKHFSDLALDVKFDVMFAFSVLIHLEDTVAESCFEFVSNFLDENGVFYANVNLGRFKDGNWLGFPVVYRTLDFYENLANKYGMIVKTIGNLKELGHDTGKASDVHQMMIEISKNKPIT